MGFSHAGGKLGEGVTFRFETRSAVSSRVNWDI